MAGGDSGIYGVHANHNAKPKEPVIAKIVECLELGMTLGCSYPLADITASTFNSWRHADPTIDARLLKARSKFESSHLRNIKNHAEQDWKASAWTLERRVPNRYSKQVVVNDQRIEVDTGLLVRVPAPEKPASLDDIQALQEQLERAQSALASAMANLPDKKGAGDGFPTGRGD